MYDKRINGTIFGGFSDMLLHVLGLTFVCSAVLRGCAEARATDLARRQRRGEKKRIGS